MGISEVKCGKCDRHYSGLRLRCPYCGARRSKNTDRKEDEGNNKRYFFGGLILVVIIITVAILIITSVNNKAPKTSNAPQDSQYVQDEGVSSLEGEGSEPEDPTTPIEQEQGQEQEQKQEPEPVEEQKKEIKSVSIVRNGEVQTDVTFYVGDIYGYSYETDPADSEEPATWSSDDEEVAVVTQNGEITAVGPGTTFINVTVGDKTGSMIIRVKG